MLREPIHSSEAVLCAVLVGNAPGEEQANQLAARSKACPYVAQYTSTGNLVLGVFALPASKRWWIEFPQEHPELLGLETLRVFITDAVEASSPWSRGDVKPDLPIAPCGSNCGECPQYQVRCHGCPATMYYLHVKR